MIHRIVQFSLNQKFLVLMLVIFIASAGVVSFKRMPVDAYPDLSPPMVEIITQWPGHASEEIERLVTLPVEVDMNGVPKMSVMRSISLYGLSDIRLTFDEGTDDYFARQVVFERLSDVQLPQGVTPALAPLFSPSGLVYRYVIESPDRSPQELKTIEDWILERQYKQVPGVADDSGFGGTVMQYQVLLDPARLYGYHITVPQVLQQLSVNNANTGGGFYSQGGQFYYVRGLGLIKDTADIARVIIGSQNGVPVRVRDVGDVTIGHAPRLGEFGFNKNDDAVEGVILMRRGEQTQTVLQGVEEKTRELNDHILPPDVMHDQGNQENVFDRVDYQFSPADTLHLNFGYTRSWFQTPNSFDAQDATMWFGEGVPGEGGVGVANGGFAPSAAQGCTSSAFCGLAVGPADQRSKIGTVNIAPSWTHLVGTNTVFTLGFFVRRDSYNYYPSANPFSDLGPPSLQRESVSQDRTLTNPGVRASVSYVRGIHNIKAGITYEQTILTEKDSLGIVDPTLNAPCLTTGAVETPVIGPANVTMPSQCAARGFAPNDAQSERARQSCKSELQSQLRQSVSLVQSGVAAVRSDSRRNSIPNFLVISATHRRKGARALPPRHHYLEKLVLQSWIA
jgi:hypothetical protein